LQRARRADEHGTYEAGGAFHAGELARINAERDAARAREIAFMCGPSKTTQAADDWIKRDPRLEDHRAASARDATPKANTPQSRTSSGSPPGDATPRRNILAMLMAASPMAASPMAASPMAAAQADLAAKVIDFGFDTPSGSDDIPSI